MQKIVILGSTGSIGKNALAIARHLSKKIQVIGLGIHSNLTLLEEQITEFRPTYLAVSDPKAAVHARKQWPHLNILSGMEELAQVEDADVVVLALSGAAGIRPTLSAIQKGKRIALANKESLVAAGSYLMPQVKKHGAQLIPIDSEHNALFQCLHRENPHAIRRVILTSSGGPFRSHSLEDLAKVTPEQALKHPNFSMGNKITIDSSTLMNKGLEVIEAHWLFDLSLDQIDVLVHPQQLIHGMVEFVDGSTLAQMGDPDMKTPIQYALTFPERVPGLLAPLNFTKYARLDFLPPDHERFPCLRLAYEAQKVGGTLPCFMNAANEVLVQRFLNKEIGWMAIGKGLEQLMERHASVADPSLEVLLAVDLEARSLAAQI